MTPDTMKALAAWVKAAAPKNIVGGKDLPETVDLLKALDKELNPVPVEPAPTAH